MSIHLQVVDNLTPIVPHLRLWASEGACLSLRFPATGCDACVQVCPRQVLQRTDDGFALRDGCEECGRCAATCPTDALEVPGFALRALLTGQTTRIECQRVGEESGSPATQRVPCLGGLKTSQLLNLIGQGDTTVQLIDRGWCEDCPAGGQATHPATTQLTTAQRLLAEAGRDPSCLRFSHEPLPPAKPAPQGHEPVLKQPVSRRGFMRHLIGHAATVAQELPAASSQGKPAIADGSARIVPAERLRILSTLQALPGDRPTLATSLFFHVELDTGRCERHRICAMGCPVGALRNHNDAQASRLAFHPRLCIGCGECERNCPQAAVRLRPATAAEATLSPWLLDEQHWQECQHCGREFIAGQDERDDSELPCCPACEKSAGLARALFSW